jgi:hypothetical protein
MPRSLKRGEKYSSYSLFTFALDNGEWQRHAPAALYLRGRTLSTHWIEG